MGLSSDFLQLVKISSHSFGITYSYNWLKCNSIPHLCCYGVCDMYVKIGKLIGTSVGIFLASASYVLISAWTFIYCWIFIIIGSIVGERLDRKDVLPTVSKRYFPIITVSSLVLAAAAPWGIRYAELYYHAAQIPVHSSMKQVKTSWQPLSGDGYAGFSLVFTTDESAEVIYDYYVSELSKEGWGLREEWPKGKEPDKFLVNFTNSKDRLWLNYGEFPYLKLYLPKGAHHVVISYQLR